MHVSLPEWKRDFPLSGPRIVTGVGLELRTRRVEIESVKVKI